MERSARVMGFMGGLGGVPMEEHGQAARAGRGHAGVGMVLVVRGAALVRRGLGESGGAGSRHLALGILVRCLDRVNEESRH